MYMLQRAPRALYICWRQFLKSQLAIKFSNFVVSFLLFSFFFIFSFSVAVCANGALYSWGKASEGRLGQVEFSKVSSAVILYSKLSTGWRRPIGCLKLQVIFRKRATNYRALLRKLTYKLGIRHPGTLHHPIAGCLPWLSTYPMPHLWGNASEGWQG